MMAVYTQLNESDIQGIGSRYDLTIVDYETVLAGATNYNYLVRTQQGSYVLTVLEDKTFNQAVELGRLLLLLKEYAFPTTRPLFAGNGEIAIVHKGKPVMVKEYVEGEVNRDLDERMLGQVGAAMGKLHQVPVPGFLADRQPYGVRKFTHIFGQDIDREYEAWIAERFSDFAKQKPKSLPRGLIHGDLFYDNVLFEGAMLKAIIDFEEAMCEDKVFDLGMGIVGMCRVGAGVELDKARALVRGYEQVRKLEEREKGALQMFIEYAAETVSCWRYWKYHVDEPSEKNADKHRQMVRIAEEIRGVPKARFSEVVFN
jgi:homoserine kinase type II